MDIKKFKRVFLITIQIFLINLAANAQDFSRFYYITGIEDSMGVTHLFPVVHDGYNGRCTYTSDVGAVTVTDRFNRQDIWHLNTSTDSDSIFIKSGSGLWPNEDNSECESYRKYIIDFELVDQDFSKYIYNEFRYDTFKRKIVFSNGSTVETNDIYYYLIIDKEDRVVFSHYLDGSGAVKIDSLFENKVEVKLTDLDITIDDQVLHVNPYYPSHYVVRQHSRDSFPIASSLNKGETSSYHFDFYSNGPEFSINERNMFSSDSVTFYALLESEWELLRFNAHETGYEVIKSDIGWPYSFVLDPPNPSHIYIAKEDSIIFSDNYGDTFQPFFIAPNQIVGLYKKPNSNLLFFSTEEHIYQLEDGVLEIIFTVPVKTSYEENGVLIERSFTHDNITREIFVYEPKNYTPESEWPLILSFHGYSGDVPDHIDRTKMHSLADSIGYLIAYPVGLPITRDPNILPAFVPVSGAGWSVPGFSEERNEITFTDSLIQVLKREYSIDSDKIHTTGLSLGGYMAAYAATQLPDQIASFASVAGQMTDEVFELLGGETQKSGLLIHGTNDIVTSYNGLNNEYKSVELVANKLAGNNNCTDQPIQTSVEDLDTSDNTTVTFFEYIDCDEGLSVNLYRVNDGGHRWPGSGRTEPAGLGFNSKDISSSELVFEFFFNNSLIITSEELTDEDWPKEFKLSQNYPNPFNPSTNISFELPQASEVQLKVFNMLGQEVASLVEGRMNSGNHSVNFDASQLSSGVYIYRLVAGNQSITKKLTLIK